MSKLTTIYYVHASLFPTNKPDIMLRQWKSPIHSSFDIGTASKIVCTGVRYRSLQYRLWAPQLLVFDKLLVCVCLSRLQKILWQLHCRSSYPWRQQVRHKLSSQLVTTFPGSKTFLSMNKGEQHQFRFSSGSQCISFQIDCRVELPAPIRWTHGDPPPVLALLWILTKFRVKFAGVVIGFVRS